MIQKLILFESFRVFNFCNFALPRSCQTFFQEKINFSGILKFSRVKSELSGRSQNWSVEGTKRGNVDRHESGRFFRSKRSLRKKTM